MHGTTKQGVCARACAFPKHKREVFVTQNMELSPREGLTDPILEALRMVVKNSPSMEVLRH